MFLLLYGRHVAKGTNIASPYKALLTGVKDRTHPNLGELIIVHILAS